MLRFATALAWTAALVLPLNAEESSPERAPCCGARTDLHRDAVKQRSVRGGLVLETIEYCVCLQYAHTIWGDGTCSYYATDCYGAPFNWDDVCGYDDPQFCDVDGNGVVTGCGTCLYWPRRPVLEMSSGDAPLPKLLDHTIEPKPQAAAGASFFDEAFFIEASVTGREHAVKAKVFPILLQRRTTRDQTLPAQVFYLGVEVKEFPKDAKPRPVHGEAVGRHQLRIVDRERVLQIRTHSRIDS